MIKYYDNSIFVGYIKQLLHEFNLPRASVYKDGMKIFNGNFYIKDNNIYKCVNNDLVRISNYKYNKKYLNFTTNLVLKNNLYDVETHKYLGEFLRFYRDYKNIDLMSMYNCFTNEFPRNLNITIKDKTDTTIDTFITKNSEVKIYMVPVKHGQTYTIAMDCDKTIACFCGYYDNNNILTFDGVENEYLSSYKSFANIRFSKPFSQNTKTYTAEDGTSKLIYTNTGTLYKTPELTSDNNKYKDKLYMFLKVPANNSSSIVILEGDYTKNCDTYIDDDNKLHLSDKLFVYKVPTEDENVMDIRGNYDYISLLGLIQLNTQQVLLLSDRLVEYLTQMAVDSNSESYNIKRLQQTISNYKELENDDMGVWKESLRKQLYEIISEKDLNIKYTDILSYLDKDIEKELGGIE